MSSASDSGLPAFRAFEAADTDTLAGIFRAAVRVTGAAAYDIAQIAAWASSADTPAFANGLSLGHCIVAERDGAIVGFGQLYPPLDHVHLLYVAPAFARQGIASALLERLEAVAIKAGAHMLGCNASQLSQPVFARAGWRLDEVESVERGDVRFERFRMSKSLGGDQGAER
ncbi:MAG: GNAT family N-acetyltransferase [Betaproteobacteria bacterium]|nr:GNAT family N-acetyltransferase [Betaproteobacteria bacterium]